MRVPSSRSETPAFATMLREAPLLRLTQCIQPRTARLAWPRDFFGKRVTLTGMIDFLKLLGGSLVGLFRSHATREAEMAFLR